jgi:hypothetical protein
MPETPAAQGVSNEAGTAAVVVNLRGHGQFWQNVVDSNINKNSAVAAAITEIGFSADGEGPVRGQARMQVSNVVPRNGGAHMWVNIDAPSDRTFRLHYVIG